MTLDELKRRTAARVAAGVAIGMPGADRPGPAPPRARFALRTLCPQLGVRVGGPCGAALYRCGFDGAVVTRFGGCRDAARTCRECPHHPAASQSPRA
jgi:hypothetical protein